MLGVAHERWKEVQSVLDKAMPERKVRLVQSSRLVFVTSATFDHALSSSSGYE